VTYLKIVFRIFLEILAIHIHTKLGIVRSTEFKTGIPPKRVASTSPWLVIDLGQYRIEGLNLSGYVRLLNQPHLLMIRQISATCFEREMVM
jgi:hypothetical protein